MLCSSRTGISLLAPCPSAAVLEGAAGAGRWLDPTVKEAVHDRATAAASPSNYYSGPCYSTPRMFDDLDRVVVDPIWSDFWQDSSVFNHPKSANGLEKVSPTYGITPASSSPFITEFMPDQLLSNVSVPQIVSSQSRDNDNDRCTSSGTAKGFSCQSDNSAMEEYATGELGNSFSSMLDCKDSFSLEESHNSSNGGTMEYDGNCGDDQDASFLGYDWASITDFDDLDEIFSNYSVLGDWAAGKSVEVSSPADSTCSRLPSHLLPENKTRMVTGESSSYHLQDSEECHEEARVETSKPSRYSMMEDKANMNGEEGHHPSQLSSSSDWISDLDDDEAGCISLEVLSQQGHSKFVGNLLLDQQTPGQDDFAVPSLSPLHVAKKQRHHVPDGYVAYYPCNSENVSSVPSSGEVLSTMPTMTTLQKIGKLRCNQQLQATLAINQQQKRFDLQFSGLDLDVPHIALQTNQGNESSGSNRKTVNCEEISRNSQLQETNTPGADEVDDISSGLSQAASVLSDLQNTISKLDDNFRTCIRDGLFRLASIERCNSHDSGTNTCSGADNEVTLAIGMMMKSL